MRRLILLLFLNCLFCTVNGQGKVDIKFIKHLVDKEYFKESLLLLKDFHSSNISEFKRDSLYFYKGWSLYSLKQLDESVNSLLKVSRKSLFYNKSRFLAAYNSLYCGRYKFADSLLVNYTSESEVFISLKNFELAGSALLNRKYDDFYKYMDKVDTSYYNLTKESYKLSCYSEQLKNHRKKSPVLAGFLSAIIPGSGKIYAGKVGTGISGLLTVGGLGLVTLENYNKRGIKDYRTIILGTIFSAFYIGNIYGSYVSVKINEQEYEQEYQNKILFNLHIPVRNIFN